MPIYLVDKPPLRRMRRAWDVEVIVEFGIILALMVLRWWYLAIVRSSRLALLCKPRFSDLSRMWASAIGTHFRWRIALFILRCRWTRIGAPLGCKGESSKLCQCSKWSLSAASAINLVPIHPFELSSSGTLQLHLTREPQSNHPINGSLGRSHSEQPRIHS